MKTLFKFFFTVAFFALTSATFAQNWSTNGSNLYVNPTTTNVGIGTNDPGSTTLKIYKADTPTFELQSQRSRLNIFLGPESFQTTNSRYTKRGDVVFRNLGESHNMIFWMPDNNNDGNSYIGFADDLHDIWMRISNNKTVRIDGKVYANEIEVKSNVWSDFVFKPDYKLMPLEEVELFIQKNNHLPDIPSEQEVKKGGINLAEMDALLLQKIEELTLYIIEQQKEIESLKN